GCDARRSVARDASTSAQRLKPPNKMTIKNGVVHISPRSQETAHRENGQPGADDSHGSRILARQRPNRSKETLQHGQLVEQLFFRRADDCVERALTGE